VVLDPAIGKADRSTAVFEGSIRGYETEASGRLPLLERDPSGLNRFELPGET
jgi:hypothetical protein